MYTYSLIHSPNIPSVEWYLGISKKGEVKNGRRVRSVLKIAHFLPAYPPEEIVCWRRKRMKWRLVSNIITRAHNCVYAWLLITPKMSRAWGAVKYHIALTFPFPEISFTLSPSLSFSIPLPSPTPPLTPTFYPPLTPTFYLSPSLLNARRLYIFLTKSTTQQQFYYERRHQREEKWDDFEQHRERNENQTQHGKLSKSGSSWFFFVFLSFWYRQHLKLLVVLLLFA